MGNLSSNPLIRLENITIYGDKIKGVSKPIVKKINLTVNMNETIGIVGPSGSGKTTLLKAISLLSTNQVTGSYFFNDTQVIPSANGSKFKIRKDLVFIHQQPVLFKGSTKYNIEYGLKIRKMDIDEDYLEKLISSFNLEDKLNRNVKLLSGGERQRVCLLRAMAIKPKVLILDEPTQNLDPANIRIIEDNLEFFRTAFNGTIIIVTHNLFQAKRITNKLGILINGEIIEFGITSDLFTNPKNQKTSDFLTGKEIFWGHNYELWWC